MSKVLKICPYCGKQVPEGTKVCPACKRSLTLPLPAEKRPEPVEREPEKPAFKELGTEAPRSRRAGLSKGAIAVLVVSIVVLVAAIVVLVAVLTGDGLGLAALTGSTSTPAADYTPSATFAIPLGEPTAEPTPEPTAEPAPTLPAEPTAEPSDAPEQTPAQEPGQEEAEAEDPVTEQNDTVWVSGSNVNVRTGPGTDYDAIGSVNTGDKLTRTGVTDNGWSRVEYDGETGYVFSELLSDEEVTASAAIEDADGFVACSDSVTVTAEANVRTGPSTNDSVAGVAKVGTTLERTGVSAKWSRVTFDGKTCYIHNNLISAKAGSDGFAVANDTVTIGTKANIRSGPSTNDSVVTVASVGQTFTRTGTSAKWSRIEYNGQTCYVHNNMLK